MKKTKKLTRKTLTVLWVKDEDFAVGLRPVENVYAKCPNIIVLPLANKESAFFQPPPLAA